MNIGCYFGSFNPIHHGHLIIASHILHQCNLDQIWFVVSPQNPLKPAQGLLNEYHRLYLVQLALEGEAKMRATDIEFKLPKPSYTIDTLTYLQEKYPQHSLSVIMGSDSYQNISKWKNYEQLLKHYPILIYMRPGYPVNNIAEMTNITTVKAPLLEISATQVRNNIRAGQSIRYLVPENVREEIEKNSYYKI
jgi:nicotinate-nucleotide adenylyltransferase